ncbi:MAG: S-adenosylmethionine decarboxylase [Anaerovibrio sp.]|nr:S-adenosylmethionine decarboxylase [Anaerovibrio sp.]
MKILARHLTIDMYKCQQSCFEDTERLLDMIRALLEESKLEILSSTSQEMPDGHLAVMAVFSEGHMTFHAFPKLRYISADTFLCQQNATPELLFNTFRRIFKPEKTKTTLLRRGDFGAVKDMKPRYHTRTAPLRKIRNTGSKVIHILTRKNG